MDGKNLRENRKLNQKKMVVTAMLIGITVALSPLSIPVGTSRCFPVQHMMNVIIAVILGPGYGVSAAFVTSVIRNGNVIGISRKHDRSVIMWNRV